MLAREKHRSIDRDRQAPVTSAKHNGTQYQLRQDVEGATEAVCNPWRPCADSDASVRRYRFENNVEHAECHRITFEGRRFDNGDEKNGDADPPKVVRELTPKLLPHKVTATGRVFGPCSMALSQPGQNRTADLRLLIVGAMEVRIVCVYSQRPLLVDI